MNLKIIVSLVLIVIGLALYFTWQRQPDNIPINKEENMKTIISKDGTKIAYIKSGSGPVVILVGGALQSKSDQLMEGLMPLLAKDFTVVSYDRRGRGDSGDTKPYDIDREIEDLEAVIKDTGGSASVFGMSSGGNLVLLAATELKDITKIATYEAPFVPEGQLNSSGADYVVELKSAIAAGKNGQAVKLFLKRIGVPSPIVMVMSFTPTWSGLKALAPTLIYDGLVVGDGTVPKQLSSVTIPVLLITGTDNRMQDASRSAVAVLSNAQQEMLQGQSHDVKPSALVPALINFFKGSN